MTQPNPGDGGNAAPQPTDPQPTAPATGTPPAQPTTPPPPPGFQPAAGTTADDDAAQQLLAAAVAQDAGGDPNQLGDAGKRALEAERERAKKAEAAAKEQQKQLTTLTEQLDALKPAAELFAQFRKVAVPEAEKTDTEKLADRLAAMEKTATDERLARLRLEVIQDKKLTKAHAEWLKGETYEELAASADALLALFPKASVPPPADPPATEPAPNGQLPAAQPEPAANGPRPDPSQGARGPVDINAQIADALAKGDVRRSIALKHQLRAQQGNQ